MNGVATVVFVQLAMLVYALVVRAKNQCVKAIRDAKSGAVSAMVHYSHRPAQPTQWVPQTPIFCQGWPPKPAMCAWV